MATDPRSPDPDDQHAGDLTVLEMARDPAEAQIIASVLRAAGIPVYVGGSVLQDEFAVSQRLLGLQSVKVQVRADQWELARSILAEARSTDPGELERQALAEGPAEGGGGPAGQPAGQKAAPPDRDRMLPGAGTVVLLVLVVTFLVLWLSARREAEDSTFLGTLYRFESFEGGALWYWKETGNLAYEIADRNRNGIEEVSRSYDRTGRLYSISFDEDEDGLRERADEHHPDGTMIIWRDTNRDGSFDQCQVKAPDGTVRELRYEAGRGFVEAR